MRLRYGSVRGEIRGFALDVQQRKQVTCTGLSVKREGSGSDDD